MRYEEGVCHQTSQESCAQGRLWKGRSPVCAPWCFTVSNHSGKRPLVTMQPPGLLGKRTSRGHAPDREELG